MDWNSLLCYLNPVLYHRHSAQMSISHRRILLLHHFKLLPVFVVSFVEADLISSVNLLLAFSSIVTMWCRANFRFPVLSSSRNGYCIDAIDSWHFAYRHNCRWRFLSLRQLCDYWEGHLHIWRIGDYDMKRSVGRVSTIPLAARRRFLPDVLGKNSIKNNSTCTVRSIAGTSLRGVKNFASQLYKLAILPWIYRYYSSRNCLLAVWSLRLRNFWLLELNDRLAEQLVACSPLFSCFLLISFVSRLIFVSSFGTKPITVVVFCLPISTHGPTMLSSLKFVSPIVFIFAHTRWKFSNHIVKNAFSQIKMGYLNFENHRNYLYFFVPCTGCPHRFITSGHNQLGILEPGDFGS